jgi:hypothetical protein
MSAETTQPSLRKVILGWTYLGTKYAENETERRHIVFSNVIYLTLPLVYVIFMVIDFEAFTIETELWKFDRLVVPSIVLLCFFFLRLNKWGFINLSRVMFLTSWILLLHIFPIILLNSPSDYYIAYPLGIIFHSLLIHLCFSARQERAKFWPFLVINAGLMLTCNTFLNAYDVTPLETNVLRSDPYFKMDVILYWLLTNLLIFYFLYIFEHYVYRLNEARAVIQEQKEEMSKKNADLQTALDSLKIVNMKIEDLNRNLEEKVSDRTKELQVKNEKLVQYAFINAHILRGPLCRIKGLYNLKKIDTALESDRALIEDMMEKSIDELSKITEDIQNVIATNEALPWPAPQ